MDERLSSNRELWNEWTGIHETSTFYDLEGFRRGGVRLRAYERDEVGEVTGKTLLHLQCHFGMDTLSWARLGATVTGVDFSDRAVELARRLADEIGTPATFVRSDVYELPSVLDGEFDIVYTSRGVLGWLPDVERWAHVAARFVKPGGFFYITEVHPVCQVFDDEASELRLRYPYASPADEAMVFPVQGSYADRDAPVEHDVEYGWNHGLGEVVSALAGAGLHIEFLHEFPFAEWEYPFLERHDDGRWWLPESAGGGLPLFFSLKASKPHRT
ncbi:MAG TPA: class I SAM-dependent methyltransferase [Actinomycetota bacterium]